MNIQALSGRVFPFQAQYKQEAAPHFGLRMAKTPAVDTVSFRGTIKSGNKSWETSRKAAGVVREQAKPGVYAVQRFMKDLFDDFIADTKHPKNPLGGLHFRLKSVNSIKEKSGSRKCGNNQEIKNELTDLIGAKIVLLDSKQTTVDKILDRFVMPIKRQEIELLEIENKRPAAVKGLPEYRACKYDYAPISTLEKLAETQNNVYKKAGSRNKVNTRLDDDFTDANYCAVHFLFKLPQTSSRKAAIFELQVLGKNMNEAKKVDDFVYKILNGKAPQGCTPEFEKLFKPLTDPAFFEQEPNAQEIVDNAQKLFNKYRAEMFLYQRKKPDAPFSGKSRKETERFLPIKDRLFPPDIEIKYNLRTEDYDFNNLAKYVPKESHKP